MKLQSSSKSCAALIRINSSQHHSEITTPEPVTYSFSCRERKKKKKELLL